MHIFLFKKISYQVDLDRSPNNCIVMERQEISAAAGIKQVYGKRKKAK